MDVHFATSKFHYGISEKMCIKLRNCDTSAGINSWETCIKNQGHRTRPWNHKTLRLSPETDSSNLQNIAEELNANPLSSILKFQPLILRIALDIAEQPHNRLTCVQEWSSIIFSDKLWKVRSWLGEWQLQFLCWKACLVPSIVCNR